MIQDMSYPRDDPTTPSVNLGIDSDNFPTAWGSFDQTVALVLSLPPGCLAVTFDISAAYHITPVRPDQQQHLCVLWKDHVYVDHAVMFGLSSSAGVFGSIGDMLVAICEKAGFFPLLKWVDDFFVIRLPDQSWTEEEFMGLTGVFGVPWSPKKTRPLAPVQRYIGFKWDLNARTVAFPLEKRLKMLMLIEDWIEAEGTFLA